MPRAPTAIKRALSARILLIWQSDQGRGNYFEVGGGGQKSPGVQGNPYPKLKTHRIWPTIFWETQIHVQTQTKIKINDIDSPKLGGGGAPTASQLWGQVAPTAPPPGSSVPESD